MDDWANQLKWNAIAYAAVAGAGLLALLGLYLFAPGLRQRWFPVPRLRPGTWTGHDVVLAFCIVFGFKLLVIALLFEVGFFTPLIDPAPANDAPQPERVVYTVRCSHICSPLSLTVVLGVLLAVMFARSGSRPRHYALSWARWPANLGLGLAAFIVARPIVMGIFALAVWGFPPRPDRPDPLLAFGKLAVPIWEWALFAFQMTVAAPILEEILFRGILQGWLRRASLVGQVALPLMTVAIAAMDFVEYDKAKETYDFQVAPVLFAIGLAAVYGYRLLCLKRQFDLSDPEMQRWQPLPDAWLLAGSAGEEGLEQRRQAREKHEQRLQSWNQANASLAICGSAMLFAVVHSGNWPAPLALAPMGLVLGWLANRTQSLIGPITFHALFNLATFIALYGSVLSSAP